MIGSSITATLFIILLIGHTIKIKSCVFNETIIVCNDGFELKYESNVDIIVIVIYYP